MRLDHVEIKNFRSIKDAKIEFDPRCRILVGMNDAGKSNILKALATLGDGNLFTESDRRLGIIGDDEPFFVRASFSPDDNDWNELKETLEKTIYCEELNLIADIIENVKKFSLNRLVTIDQGRKKQFLNFQFENLLNKISLYNINENWMKKRIDAKDNFNYRLREIMYLLEYNFLLKEAIVIIATVHGIADEIIDSIWEPVAENEIIDFIKNKITEWHDKELKIVFWKASDDKYRIHDDVSFDQFTETPNNFLFLLNMFKLYENDIADNKRVNEKLIIEKLKKLKNDNNLISNYLSQVAATLGRKFNQLWQSCILNKETIVENSFEFDLRYINNYLYFSISENRNHYSPLQRGDGFKKFIEFMLSASTYIHFDDISNTLFILDEPETNFHPSAAKDFRDELIKISEHNNNYVIYATHSISMMERDCLNRHYLVRRNNQVTKIISAEKNSISNTNELQRVLEHEILYNEVGYSIYEELQEKNIIFEGKTDKNLFLLYAKEKKLKINFGVASAWGDSTFNKISPILELAKREILIISDCDKKTVKIRKIYIEEEGYGNWLTYQDINRKSNAITAEDFLKKEFIVEQVNLYLTNYGKYFKDDAVKFTEKNLSPTSSYTGESGNCDQIKNWIENNLKKEENNSSNNKARRVKRQMNGIKTQMFKALKYENIVDEYKILYDGIIKELDLPPLDK